MPDYRLWRQCPRCDRCHFADSLCADQLGEQDRPNAERNLAGIAAARQALAAARLTALELERADLDAEHAETVTWTGRGVELPDEPRPGGEL